MNRFVKVYKVFLVKYGLKNDFLGKKNLCPQFLTTFRLRKTRSTSNASAAYFFQENKVHPLKIF